MDQQAALRWVERNIRKFGGDAGNVTIFGESAGGLSVHSHLASPLSAGLFDRAIVQSGAYALEQPSLAQAESRGRDVANIVGCGDHTAACLRGVSVEKLLESQPTTAGAIGPNLDGSVLPESIGSAFESGRFSRVPVIEGSNHDEFTIFTALYIEFVVGQIPSSFYPIIVSILLPSFGSDANPQEVVSRYPLTSSIWPALSAIGTDAVFACPGRRAAQSLSRFVPTYAYEFDDPNTPQIFVRPASFPYGAYHAGELQYLFDSPTRGHSTLDADQETLADTMVRYWTQFARAGAPNAAATPQWPAYNEANDSYQSLRPPTPQPDTGFAADHKCEFWDSQ
jgi:para-nitrobenzyl esterase